MEYTNGFMALFSGNTKVTIHAYVASAKLIRSNLEPQKLCNKALIECTQQMSVNASQAGNKTDRTWYQPKMKRAMKHQVCLDRYSEVAMVFHP